MMMFVLLLLVLSCWWGLYDAKATRSPFLNGVWKQALFEQEVEDKNALPKFNNHLTRRLIVMPLTSAFNPNQISSMHGKVQYGDKCSLPASLGRVIFEKPVEVPWLFEVEPVKRRNIPSKSIPAVTKAMLNGNDGNGRTLHQRLDVAYISPLDFRSPENYIFLPQWLMKDLDILPNDIVDVSFVRIKLAGLVVLQPMTKEWDSLIETHGDPKQLLEHEINKYSSLTAGSHIVIEIKGVEYPIFVKEVFAENGVSVRAVCIQDSDVKVDIDRRFLDFL